MRSVVVRLVKGIASVLLLVIVFTKTTVAKVKLPSFFSDNMVLQQKTNAAVWGKADPGKTITISTTWSRKRYASKADGNGNWKIMVATPSYGGPYAITIFDGEPLILMNVLIGEVWICSGQSNMEMPLAGWGKITNYEQEIKDAKYPNIRLLQVNHVVSNVPLEDAQVANSGWKPCILQYVAEFSSVAYFFAREVYKKTKVPVGLIHTSWGGTIAEAWTSASTLKNIPDFVQAVNKIQSENDNTKENYLHELEEWNKLILSNDAGYKENIPVWAGKDFDASEWPEMKIPAYWENILPAFDGVVWFQKKVMIPAQLAGKPLKINSGTIDDNDITWFNGVKIGATNGYDQTRIYQVPADLIKEGENTITIRVFDGGGGGGIYGSPELLNLIDPQEEKISLSGNWKYHIGVDLKQYPPMPASNEGPDRPTVLYNAMINPFIQYAIKGAIWYQGESNADRAYQYRSLFPALITDWRKQWGLGDFPFYFVQLANYMKTDAEPESSAWAELRDAQLQALSLPNTGMAVSIDIGNADDIHPKNKQEVGRRLALIALAKTYRVKVPYTGPVYQSQKIVGNTIVLDFGTTNGILKIKDGGVLKGFAIAGADQQFHWAKATIEGSKIIVSSEDVPDPVAVRYAWANNPVCNLMNDTGLPASPFRTDKWQDSTFPSK